MPVVKIPTPLRTYTEENKEVHVDGATVEEALRDLTENYEELEEHLYTDEEEPRLRQYVNIYVNDEDIRTRKNEETKVGEEDVINIIPAVAGGASSSEKTERSRGSNKLDDVTLDKREVERYSRHFLMPEVGEEGQKKLKSASVLMVGAGGLGAPFGMYIAAAGVGRLGVVDFDEVEFSNLQRQLLHGTEDVGRSKLDSAEETLEEINPNVELERHETRLTSENAKEIIDGYDVVVDGTDNFPTRYLVNDACAMLGVPNVYGSIFRFEGQVSVFDAERGPCYRCLYEEPPPPGLVPDCAEGGVLGVLPGIIGSLQALETIKLIIESGDPLVGRYLIFDALNMEFQELDLPKNPDCPVCGSDPEITELIDYKQFCGIDVEDEEPALSEVGEDGEKDIVGDGYPEITVKDLHRRLKNGGATPFVLDVRNPQEAEICRLDDSELIPLDELEDRVNEIPEDREIVVHCRSGTRSAEAQERLLEEHGFDDVKNLKGGIIAWAKEIDESMPVY